MRKQEVKRIKFGAVSFASKEKQKKQKEKEQKSLDTPNIGLERGDG